MVVVDNARKMIGKNVDISVTSVLKTTAGKMTFGKFDERGVPLRAEPARAPADMRSEIRPQEVSRKPQPLTAE